MNNKILIIGAGLGGLALAQGLIKAGYHVTVFERDESPTGRPQGYRISIRSLGMNALTSLLTPEKMRRLSLAKIADVGDGFTCVNEKMEPFFSIPGGQDAAVQFLRSELRTLLQEKVPIQWNKRLVKMEDTGEMVIAHFEDGSHATGDLLVGCDGGGSIVRQLLPLIYRNSLGSTPEVVDNNQAIFAGQINRTPLWDNLLPLNKKGFVRFLGPHSHQIGVCFSESVDRTPTVFWAFAAPIKDSGSLWHQFDQGVESRIRILDHCNRLMKNESWHENLRKLIQDTPAEAVMAPWLVRTTRFPKFDRFPMASTGRITLVGDAAHAMPAEKGLGVSNVFEDARLLSTLLENSEKPIDWPRLIGKYEKEMFARAKVAVQESEAAAEYFRNLRGPHS